MADRSTLEIIIAVKESKPVTEEELRLALLVMVSMEYFVRHDLERLMEAVTYSKTNAKMQAIMATKKTSAAYSMVAINLLASG